MIAALRRRWREARLPRRDRMRLSADDFIADHGGDLDTALWRARDRADDLALPRGDRQAWRDLVEEIDRRRPLPSGRADTATRMLFRDLNL